MFRACYGPPRRAQLSVTWLKTFQTPSFSRKDPHRRMSSIRALLPHAPGQNTLSATDRPNVRPSLNTRWSSAPCVNR